MSAADFSLLTQPVLTKSRFFLYNLYTIVVDVQIGSQVTEDWVPIYDKSALPGYYMAIGTSGNQFKNAGVAARLVSEMIECVRASVDSFNVCC
jgi:hypothetical protein